MATNIIARKLEVLLEADFQSGASVSSFTDQSGNGRHFEAASNLPTLSSAGAKKPDGTFHKAVVFNGTNSPLVWTGEPFKLFSGFLVCKINSVSGVDGFLSGTTENPILSGNSGNNKFFRYPYPFLEIRVNDRIYRQKIEFAPVITGEWQIIYFNFYRPVTVASLQLAQDRNLSGSKANIEIGLLALYSGFFCEEDIRKNTHSLANAYQIPVEDVYPYTAFQSSGGEKIYNLQTDNQFIPTVRRIGSPQWSKELAFSGRNDVYEFDYAEKYFDDHVSSGRSFIYREQGTLPKDKVFLFDYNQRFTDNGVPDNRRGYKFSVLETTLPTVKYIPDAPNFSDAEIPIDLEKPTIEILYPVNNQPVDGTVEIRVDARDNVKVKRVEYYLNGQYFAESNQKPFTYLWDTNNRPNGAIQLSAIAVDSSDNYSLPAAVGVIVNNLSTLPPQTTLNLTANSYEQVTASMTATDSAPIEGYTLEYSLSGNNPNAAPGTLGWITLLNDAAPQSTYIHAGLTGSTTYYYRFRARNANDFSSAWKFKNITTPVMPDETAPSVSISASAVSDSAITVGYTASDNSGFVRIDLQWSANGTTGWTDLLSNAAPASPFLHTGLNPETEYFYRLRGRDNASTPNVSAWATASATTLADTPPTAFIWTTENGFIVSTDSGEVVTTDEIE